MKLSVLLHDGFQELAKMRGAEGGSANSSSTVESQNASADSVSAHSTTQMARRTSLPVVGVKVHGENGKSVDAYALLDTGSDRTFCSPAVLHELGLEGKETSLPYAR